MYEFCPDKSFDENIAYFCWVMANNVWLTDEERGSLLKYLEGYTYNFTLADDLYVYLSK